MDIRQLNNNHRPAVLIILLCIVATLIYCQQRTASTANSEDSEQPELPQDFLEFYRNFHSDSIYQLSHITFPLQGMMRDSAGRDSAVTWTANSWVLHHPVIPDDFWQLDFTMPMDNIVVEFIHAKHGGYWMERRFAKLDDKWYLIYYSDLKAPQNKEDEGEKR